MSVDHQKRIHRGRRLVPFFSSVFCFLFFSLGDGEPGYRPSTPKVYTGNRRVRKLVGIGADAQPPSPPEDGTLPIVFGGLRRAGRIRIGGSLVGGQERKMHRNT